jgi:endonuclease/exonuclease/phosphatase family metal-dependent hydrolase
MIILSGCASKRAGVPVSCPDIAQTGRLNVLTLNMLYDVPAAARQQTFNDIAETAVANQVHVLLLQEAVLSDVDRIQDILGTSNSARELQRVLNGQSEEPYDLRVVWETGVPLVLSTANAILSRCDITRHFSAFLPIESEESFQGVDFKITRNVQVAQIDLPGYGSLRVYNTHLCSGCSTDALQRQVTALMEFVTRIEGTSAAEHVVLGGDLNLDLAKGAGERAVYGIIRQAGFRDIYAEYRKRQFGDTLDQLCWNGRADIHCTDGVSSIQGIIAQQTGASFATPSRIDYLFLRSAAMVFTSRVVFNPGNQQTGPINSTEPAVSDHSGVFGQITLAR